MKKILLLFFATSICFSDLIAQSFSIDPNPAFATADLDDFSTNPQDMLAVSSFSNNSSDTLYLKWERIFVDLPDSWVSSVDDHFISHLPFVDSFSLTLLPNQVGTLNVHAYPAGEPCCILENGAIPGVGEVHIRITNPNAPTDTLIAVYHFTLIGSPILNLSEIELEKIKIFPNPSSDYFYLTNSEKIQSLVIYNELGHQLRTFAVKANQYYEINDLPKGSYFIGLIDKDQKSVKTLRLQKG